MRKLSVLVPALALGLIAQSCAGLGGDGVSEEDFYGFFLRDAATVQAMGLPVYWLGREFTAGGVTFRGPHGNGFAGEIEGGGIRMNYPPDGGNPGAGLNVLVYSRAAWDLVKQRMLTPPPPLPGEGEVVRQTVVVLGRQAELISVPQLTRPVARLELVIDLDAVVVVGEAYSVLGPTTQGDSELSIFIKNPDLLVQVMQDLRPYPE